MSSPSSADNTVDGQAVNQTVNVPELLGEVLARLRLLEEYQNHPEIQVRTRSGLVDAFRDGGSLVIEDRFADATEGAAGQPSRSSCLNNGDRECASYHGNTGRTPGRTLEVDLPLFTGEDAADWFLWFEHTVASHDSSLESFEARAKLRSLLKKVPLQSFGIKLNSSYAQIKQRLLNEYQRRPDEIWQAVVSARPQVKENPEDFEQRILTGLQELTEAMPGFSREEALIHMLCKPHEFGVRPGATGSYEGARAEMRRRFDLQIRQPAATGLPLDKPPVYPKFQQGAPQQWPSRGQPQQQQRQPQRWTGRQHLPAAQPSSKPFDRRIPFQSTGRSQVATVQAEEPERDEDNILEAVTEEAPKEYGC